MDPRRDEKSVERIRHGGHKRIVSSGSESDDKSRVVKLKYDIDERILVCIICKRELSAPVCQCKNNHLACQVCCKTRTKGQCPKCSQPIGRTRNKAIEEMIATLRVPCRHATNGCRRMLANASRKQHELYDCEFLLLNCPFPDCTYRSCLLRYSSHVEHKHENVRVIPHNPNEELLTFGSFHLGSRDELLVLKANPELFLLHQEESSVGRLVYVTSRGVDKRYTLKIVIANENGQGSKIFKADVQTSNRQAKSAERDFLLIPHQRVSSSARCTVHVPQD